MDSGNILCFVCSNYFGTNEIQNHVYKCKLTYETKIKKKISLPEEYNLLFTTFKGGLSLQPDEIENFNGMIAAKLVKGGGGGGGARTGGGMSNTGGGSNYSQTAPIKSGSGYGGGGFSNTVQQPARKKSPPRQPGQRPRMLVCPLCGREFGTMSLPIHMKTCRQKFEIEQQNLPKNLRRNADKIIEQYNKNNAMLQASGNYDMDAINNQAFDTYNTQALVPCENCGRTFLPDRLIVHLRSCKKKK